MAAPAPMPEKNGPVSRKIIAQALTNILVLVVAFIATKQGLDLSVEASSEISGLLSVLSGLFAGWLIRDPAPAEDKPE